MYFPVFQELMSNSFIIQETPHLLHPSGRPKRNAQLPLRFRDTLPPPPPLLPISMPIETPNSANAPPHPVETECRTNVNNYGIYRVYRGSAPTFTPDDMFNIASVADSPNFTSSPMVPVDRSLPFNIVSEADQPSYLPFANKTTHMLMNWYYNGSSTTSATKLNTLVNEVILDPVFKSEDLKGFDADR